MGSFFFLPNPLYLLIVKGESLLSLSTAKGLWRGDYFGYDFLCAYCTICTAAQFPELRRENLFSEGHSGREGSDSAWGLGLCPTSCGLPTGSSSVTAGLLHPCQGLKTDSKQWEVTMTSGLTSTSTFSTTNTLFRPDFWQEKQVPCLRFPFKDFSQPSFNSASYSITQRKEAFSLPPSCYHTTFWNRCPFLSHMGMEEHKFWRNRNALRWPWRLLGFLHMLLYLSFPLTFSLRSRN